MQHMHNAVKDSTAGENEKWMRVRVRMVSDTVGMLIGFEGM